MFTAKEYWELMQEKLDSMGIEIPLEELIIVHAEISKKRMYEWKDLNIPNKTYRDKIRKALDKIVYGQSSFGGAA